MILEKATTYTFLMKVKLRRQTLSKNGWDHVNLVFLEGFAIGQLMSQYLCVP